MVAPSRKERHIHSNVRSNVELGACLYTDAMQAYKDLSNDFVHSFVDHISKYVDNRVHTNGLENFWSLLKRTLGGTYVSVDPMHLCRYIDEQCFRYNHRKLTDLERFMIVVAGVIDKRITYAELTGKTGEKDPI
jgi:hypothetical protein